LRTPRPRLPDDKPTLNQFLFDFALGYRVRRLDYLRGKVDQLYLLDEQARQTPTGEKSPPPLPADEAQELRRVLLQIKGRLVAGSRNLARLQGANQAAGVAGAAADPGPLLARLAVLIKALRELPISPQALRGILGKDLPAGLLGPGPEAEPADVARLRRAHAYLVGHADTTARLNTLADQLGALLSGAMRETDRACRNALLARDAGDTEYVRVARRVLWDAYYKYDERDMVLFPILYGTEVGEAATVDIVRISPEDATALINEQDPNERRRKLAGTALFHFGAFLDRGWRFNDMLWGRLDGAERLITALLPDARDAAVRDALIAEAHGAILLEELARADRKALTGAFGAAVVAHCAGNPAAQAVRQFAGSLDASVTQQALVQFLRTCLLQQADLLTYVRTTYDVNRQLEPEPLARVASRGTEVVGKIVQQLARKAGIKGGPAAWLAWMGKLSWGLVAVAVPGSLPNLVWRHWLALLCLCEILLIVAGLLVYRPVLYFGLAALGVTVGLQALTAILGNLLRGQRAALYGLLLGLSLLGGALVFLGGATVYAAWRGQELPSAAVPLGLQVVVGTAVLLVAGGLLGDALRERPSLWRLARLGLWVAGGALAVLGGLEVLNAVGILPNRPLEHLQEWGRWLWNKLPFLGG
jgi:hypothetical protein